MAEPDASTIDESSEDTAGAGDLPMGNHALEVAARRGIGPLSPGCKEVWHGKARPCVSCGQLILRDTLHCDFCEQDHTGQMLQKMRLHSGPWYVLEHVRPFPGVSLERITRQIRRGLITETSIVRGPSTDHQWRFAAETPGLCLFFERCWRCHARVSALDSVCLSCSVSLTFEQARTETAGTRPAPESERVATAPASSPCSAKLAQLSVAVTQTDLPEREDTWDSPPQVAGVRATWIVAAMLIVVIFVLMWFTRSRESDTRTSLDSAPVRVVMDVVTPREG